MAQISPQKLLKFLRKNYKVKSDIGAEVRVCCPSCWDGDPEGHLYVNLSKGVGYCFRCGFSPNFYNTSEVLTQRTNISDWDKTVAKLLGNQKAGKSDEIYSVDWPKSIDFLPSVSFLGRRAQKYLTKRGFQFPDVAVEHKFGVCNDGYMVGRLVLPVLEQGRLVYYTGRTLLGHQKKYLNPDSETAPKGKAEFLFNLGAASLFESIVLVEGIFDAIRVGRNALAILGNNISDIQLEKLILSGFQRVLVCLDGDARKYAMELAEVLNPHFETWIAFLPIDLDPDRYIKDRPISAQKAPHIFHPLLDPIAQRFHKGLALSC